MTIADSRVVKRMDFVTGNGGAMIPDPDGDYIRYSDHLTLLAETERERDRALREADNLHRGCADLVEQNLALQSRLDAVLRLADEWYAGDGYETGIPRIDEATNNRWSAKQECANELRAALGGESPGNEEERK